MQIVRGTSKVTWYVLNEYKNKSDLRSEYRKQVQWHALDLSVQHPLFQNDPEVVNKDIFVLLVRPASWLPTRPAQFILANIYEYADILYCTKI